MKETCQLLFRTSLQKTRQLSVRDPHPALSAANVLSAANTIITANPFNQEVGHLVNFVSAHRVNVTRKPIFGFEDATA
jgi:hypothetical protein